MAKALFEDSLFFEPSRRRSLGPSRLRRPWVHAFRRTVWRRLPHPVRQTLLDLLLSRSDASIAIDAPAASPVCVAGLLSSPTGSGVGGRLCGRALAALGYDVRSVDLSGLLVGGEAAQDCPPLLESGAGTIILHFNPDNLSRVMTLLGRRRLRGKRIVGYWAWELPRIPEHWLPALDEVDEVWTPSRFVAEAVRPFTAKPVRVVPHPVAQGRAGRRRRDRFGFGARFVVLSMFSFASSFPRKNPVAAIEAFKRAFGDADDRLLYVKVSGMAEAHPEDLAALFDAVGTAPNIRLEERAMSHQERLDLIASVDLFLSLHRSEGFGLVLAEAMLADVPVVSSAWSGNLDFMDHSSALLVPVRLVDAWDRRGIYNFGECWAEPDVDAAAAHLAAVAADPTGFVPMRRAARAMAIDRLGLAGFARAVEPALPPLFSPAHEFRPAAETPLAEAGC